MSRLTKLVPNVFLTLFILFSLANFFSLATATTTDNLLTKPLLMIWLGVYAYSILEKPIAPYGKWLLTGLFFSFLGDTFLIFVGKDDRFFLLGLGSFLLTHVAYWLAFHLWPQAKPGLLKSRPFWTLPFVLFWLIMMYLLWPRLPGSLLAPVVVYSMVITLMAAKAAHISPNLRVLNQWYLISGAVLFVLSDSIIAFSRFTDYLPTNTLATGLAIMITYLSGQLLIVWGLGRAL